MAIAIKITSHGPHGEPPVSPHRVDLRHHDERAAPRHGAASSHVHKKVAPPSAFLKPIDSRPSQVGGVLSHMRIKKQSRNRISLNFITTLNPEQRVNTAILQGVRGCLSKTKRTLEHLRRFTRTAWVFTILGTRRLKEGIEGIRKSAHRTGTAYFTSRASSEDVEHFDRAPGLNIGEDNDSSRTMPPPHLHVYEGDNDTTASDSGWHWVWHARRRDLAVFIIATSLVVLVFQGVLSVISFKTTHGIVLGEATAGVHALLEAQSSFSRADTNAALRSFLDAQMRFEHASQALRAMHFSALLKHVPLFRSGSNLIAMGEQTSAAAEHLLLALKSLDEARVLLSANPGVSISALNNQHDAPSTESVLFAVPLIPLRTASDHLNEASKALANSQQHMSDIDIQHIPSEYRDAAASMERVLLPASRLTRRAAGALDIISLMLGMHGSRRLALVFQNDTELRATGGFMGSFSYVDTANGNVTAIQVPGGGFYDLKGSMTVRTDAPYPFHIFSPYWQPWNANYLFDFPSSARSITWFVEKSQGPTIDGIIAVTPQLLEDLLALTGPVILPEYQLAIDEKNMLRALQDEVEVHYDKDLNQPKAVIGALLPVVMKRIPTALRNDPMGFAQAFTRAIDRRDLMIWSAREEEQSLIETMGWGGSVLQGEGDYLAVVHTNIGGGKTDRVMEETWERNLTFEGTSPITAQLVITRTHRGNPTDPYEKVQNVDYVRIFTPLGSELIGAQGFREPSTSLFKYERNLSPHPELVSLRASEKVHPAYNIRTTEEHGHTVFGGWIMTKVGVQSVVTLRYRIPYERAMIDHGVGLRAAIGGNVSTDRYRLTLQRQPGARVAKFIDTHISPASWGMADFNLIDEAGITSSLDKNMITFGVDHDMVYEVEWFHE